MEKIVYSQEKLYNSKPQREYSGEAQAAAFLLGGIGTGNVSIGSRGEFRDWEIYNRPGKGVTFPNTFFAIWAKPKGGESIAKVLESKIHPPHNLSHGYHPVTGAGLPRLEKSTLLGEYPFVKLKFEDNDLPVEVNMEAFTPMIPLNPKDSGIPGAIITYQLKNITEREVDVSIAGSIINPIGGITFDRFGNLEEVPNSGNLNDYKSAEDFSGLYLHSNKYSSTDINYGDVSLTTTNKHTKYKRVWFRGAWYDDLQEFWNDFSRNGEINDLEYSTESNKGGSDTGTLGVYETLLPGETKEIKFFLTWYFPNRLNGWGEEHRVKEDGRKTIRNYYTNHFDSSWSVATYLIKHLDKLESQSRVFKNALFNSSLPNYVIDAIASNITVLRSTTCFWLKDGRFLGYEGCFDDWGCCDGNCTHVWNYAQTLAFLFPTLEQNMRQTEFLEETDTDGKMNFRAVKMFESEWLWRGKLGPAAADGQMGTIMRVYREWKLTGDKQFLKQLWPMVKKALDYGLFQWDTDQDLVFDSEQHNTYDIEFYGPNPLTGVFFLGALRAAQEMAAYLGETETENNYKRIFEKSSEKLDELLWNGEYYIQLIDDVNKYKYQHGIGCLSDQLLAQQLAHVYGLGYLLPEDKVKKAIHSIYKYNFKEDFRQHQNAQRTYVLNDEKGLLLCSWPNGGRPKLPFVYSDEVWTGIEYQVATHLIYEGFIDEGLTMVKAVRDRHDGIRRNPWNEVECGHHYARSMSSWGLLNALSGFQFDMAQKEISFNPLINEENFSTFWSTGTAWGTFEQKRDNATGDWETKLKVLYGNAAGIKVKVREEQFVIQS